MHLFLNECYHIYNRGNNKQIIFFNKDHYLLFIQKIRQLIIPCSDILAWCLMPNHYHLLIHANEKTVQERVAFGGKPMQEFAYRIGMLQSSYSQAINRIHATTGSLFQQKAKCKAVSTSKPGSISNDLNNCFYYIHANPVEAKLTMDPADWPFSSFTDYIGLRKGTICNQELGFRLSGLSREGFISWRNGIIAGHQS